MRLFILQEKSSTDITENRKCSFLLQIAYTIEQFIDFSCKIFVKFLDTNDDDKVKNGTEFEDKTLFTLTYKKIPLSTRVIKNTFWSLNGLRLQLNKHSVMAVWNLIQCFALYTQGQSYYIERSCDPWGWVNEGSLNH